mgnify:CR=1 FL=1
MKTMKRFAARICALFVVLTVSLTALVPAAFAATKAQLPDLPSSQCVVDDANILSSSTKTAIENLNAQLTQQCEGAQIGVLTVDYTGSLSTEDYAVQAANTWGLGSSSKNNGVLILLVMQSQQYADGDYYLATGDGFRNTMLEKQASAIAQTMEDSFAAGDYDAAVTTCANNVASTIADLYGVTLSGTTGTVSNGNTDGYNNGNDYYEAPAASYQSPFLTLLAVVIVVFALTSIFGGIRRGFGGGGFGPFFGFGLGYGLGSRRRRRPPYDDWGPGGPRGPRGPRPPRGGPRPPRGGGGFGGIGSVGKSNAKVYMEKSTGVTFKDVAGQDEAKESLEEIIDFLHNPGKYTAIGAKLPKGALLVGSPGTGKTLLAKAVAGEAGVPFFSISGSDFVEMFVGVGASRVRDLFKEASKVAPCIIFIDEIDTIGKSRDASKFGGGNDEREQTLNQLLAELDGFDPGKGVIVLGATNRPEVLDKALLRPGRFDRRITVDRPNLAGRLATLQVHTRNIKLAEDVNLEKIAQATAGCVGADLANLVNEAALRAVRKGRRAVNQDDLLVSFELVIAGSEKKGTVITEEEKRIIAYHEVGHALVAAKQKNAQPVSKITIVPHTQGALGYTLHLPEEEKFLMSKEDILAEIRTLLAGRSSEEVVCNTMTSGAANDIERATEMARNLVARFGMCDEFDMMALGTVQSQYLDGGYSMSCAQETYAAADRETIKILRQCHEEAKAILRENRELLDKIAAYLLKKETITGQEMMAIIEGRDPETVDNYGASKSSQPAFRPSVPETIEAPAKHINIVSEPVPMPDFDEKPEEKKPEDTPEPPADSPAEDKPE